VKWTTLVVRLWYSNEFEHRELGRNAAEFAFSGRTLGVKIDNRQGEGSGTISLYFDREVPDELKAIFIEYVHRHLAKYACDVTRDRSYVCPNCGKPVKDHDEVRGGWRRRRTSSIARAATRRWREVARRPWDVGRRHGDARQRAHAKRPKSQNYC
jgi:hypothetical protein